MANSFSIVMPVYHEVNLFDVAAPRELFGWWSNMDGSRDIEIVCGAVTQGEVESYAPKQSQTGLKILAEKAFDEIGHVDLLWVPGGSIEALRREMGNSDYIEFLKHAAKNATYVASVCEGALLTAKAGLLDGFKATTHWAFVKCLKQFPGIRVIPDPDEPGTPTFPRFVVDDHCGSLTKGIRVTGGGISSAMDESLEVIRISGGEDIAQRVQTVTQYFPDPPITAPQPDIRDCPMGDFSAPRPA